MTHISINTLMKINPNANITFIRIWDETKDDTDVVYRGMMDKCPKEYLHKPIAEMSCGEFEYVFYF